MFCLDVADRSFWLLALDVGSGPGFDPCVGSTLQPHQHPGRVDLAGPWCLGVRFCLWSGHRGISLEPMAAPCLLSGALGAAEG